jgi:UDP-N-acetylglucosamine 4,6-dehydratase
VIQPTILFSKPVDFTVSAKGERGKRVPEGFEYSSGKNEDMLSLDGFRELI